MEPTNDQKVIRVVIEKAWSDPAFKKNLLKKPVATLEDFLGRPIHLPDGKEKLVFVDQTETSTIFINIPAPKANVEVEDMELSEDQLDGVSGGTGDGPFGSIRPESQSDNI